MTVFVVAHVRFYCFYTALIQAQTPRTSSLLFLPCSRTQYLDSENSQKPIYLYVNCPGGSVIAGLAMYDTMQHIRSEVVTINVGLAASMASFILAAGTKVRGRLTVHFVFLFIQQYRCFTFFYLFKLRYFISVNFAGSQTLHTLDQKWW